MPKAGNPTPVDQAARLVRAYAAEWDAETDEDAPIHLLKAVGQALDSREVCYIGCAILSRHQSLADASYRLDAPNCDPDVTTMRNLLEAVNFWRG